MTLFKTLSVVVLLSGYLWGVAITTRQVNVKLGSLVTAFAGAQKTP